MGEIHPQRSKLPPADRERRATQSAADRARDRGPAVSAPLPPEPERRRRQSQSDIDRARTERWADLPEEERRRRQSQSDTDRAAARAAAEAAELENDATLQAMWNTIEHGGYDFMARGDW
jgi:hypothetical protein